MRYFNFTSSLVKNQDSVLVYKIADSIYQSNFEIPELNYLIEPVAVYQRLITPSCLDYKTQTFSDKCIIGDKEYFLQVSFNDSGAYQLKIGSDLYHIDKNNICADILKFDITLLTGPVLILNLALNDIFCLHASCFVFKNKIFILMANSGTGKSTIATYIENNTQGSRIADDIVPFKIVDDQIRILPHYVQLKLQEQQQCIEDITNKDVILIFAKHSSCETRLEKINSFAATKKIIQHTVATKLFARKELNTHLNVSHAVAKLAQNFELNYQHSEHSLLQLIEQINEYC